MKYFNTLVEYIIKYQNQFLLALAIILAVVIIALIVHAIKKSAAKRELLSQINEKVSEINNAVSNLSEKKYPEVIYIDNRVGNPGADLAPEVMATSEAEVTDTEDAPAEEETETEAGDAKEPEDGQAETEELNQDKTEEIPPRHYFSFDCAVAKDGKVYTLEELNRQIRE